VVVCQEGEPLHRRLGMPVAWHHAHVLIGGPALGWLPAAGRAGSAARMPALLMCSSHGRHPGSRATQGGHWLSEQARVPAWHHHWTQLPCSPPPLPELFFVQTHHPHYI
jgi:hypothetical protein